MTITKLGINVSTAVASSTMQLGIYSLAGSKLCATSTIATTSTGLKQGAVTSTTLQPGFYYAAFVKSIATIVCDGVGNEGTGGLIDNLMVGFAANGLSGGALPSSLGTITADGNNPTTVGLYQ
jgi:hypothetical protein